MTNDVYMDARGGIGGKMRDMAGGVMDMVRAAAKEAMTWDFYKWTVLAIAIATFLLIALSYGGIRAELAALKQPSAPTDSSARDAAIDKQMADMKAALMQSMAEMKSGLSADIARLGSKIDARSQPKPVAPAPKPAARPRPQ
jgi:F0F1-type ATP synthase membrane subunit a